MFVPHGTRRRKGVSHHGDVEKPAGQPTRQEKRRPKGRLLKSYLGDQNLKNRISHRNEFHRPMPHWLKMETGCHHSDARACSGSQPVATRPNRY